ncbi:MAG: hypothetical protein KBT67_09165 [bacterium]|nr:hypothetical protein [Candidatus Limimorpha caballi]
MKKVLIAVLLLVGGMTLFTNCKHDDTIAPDMLNVENTIENGVETESDVIDLEQNN